MALLADAAGLINTATTCKTGDHVRWNSDAGYESGKIIKVHATNVDYKDHTHHASQDETPPSFGSFFAALYTVDA